MMTTEVPVMTRGQMFAELSQDRRAAELTAARSEISSFIFSEPAAELMVTPRGALTRAEARARLELATKYARPKVRDWLAERGADLEVLVATTAGQSRLEFCKALAGDFVPSEDA